MCVAWDCFPDSEHLPGHQENRYPSLWCAADDHFHPKEMLSTPDLQALQSRHCTFYLESSLLSQRRFHLISTSSGTSFLARLCPTLWSSSPFRLSFVRALRSTAAQAAASRLCSLKFNFLSHLYSMALMPANSWWTFWVSAWSLIPSVLCPDSFISAMALLLTCFWELSQSPFSTRTNSRPLGLLNWMVWCSLWLFTWYNTTFARTLLYPVFSASSQLLLAGFVVYCFNTVGLPFPDIISLLSNFILILF